MFRSEKMLVEKNIGSKKDFWLEKIFGLKRILGKQKFGPKEFGPFPENQPEFGLNLLRMSDFFKF